MSQFEIKKIVIILNLNYFETEIKKKWRAQVRANSLQSLLDVEVATHEERLVGES